MFGSISEQRELTVRSDDEGLRRYSGIRNVNVESRPFSAETMPSSRPELKTENATTAKQIVIFWRFAVMKFVFSWSNRRPDISRNI